MPIQGLRTTANFVNDQRPKNWRETVLLLYPNGKAPLTALTSVMKSEKTDDPEFYWWEKALPDQRMALSADIAISDIQIPVVSGALGCREGHIIRIEESGELVRVIADPSSDTSLIVQRGFAGTTPTAVTYNGAGVNPNIHIVGSAFEQGSSAPTGISYDPNKRVNYTQIFRNTLEMTRSAAKTRLRTGDQVKEAKRECLELHTIEMEKAFWFGQKTVTTHKGKPLYTTDGVIKFIDTGNIVTASGNTGDDMETLEGWMKRMFAFGSSEKVGFCGNTSLLAIQQIIRKNSAFNIQSGIKEYGMNVTRLTCPFGELVLKTHPLFNQVTGGTNGAQPYYGLDSWLVVLDMQELKYRYFVDGDTKYQADLQENGVDGMKSGYITDAGLEVHHPKAHFLIKNLAKGKKDA